MSDTPIGDEIEGIAGRIASHARSHACAGYHCATCYPSQNEGELNELAEKVRKLERDLAGARSRSGCICAYSVVPIDGCPVHDMRK